MPGRKRHFLRLHVLGRRGDDWEYEVADQAAEVDEAPKSSPSAPRRKGRRYAMAAAFTTLFFAGAAFTAGAGDQMVRLTDEDAAALEAESTDPAAETPAPDAAADPAAAPAPEQSAAPEAAAPEAAAARLPRQRLLRPRPWLPPPHRRQKLLPRPPLRRPPPPSPRDAEATAAAPSVRKASSTQAPASRAAKPAASKPAAPAKKPGAKSVLKRAAAPAPVPEIEREHGEPTIWLNRALPDPTPASARLTRSFARTLKTTAKRHGADWAAVLAVLRADGHRGSVPATQQELDRLAEQLAGRQAWRGALALSGRTDFADQAAALADLYRSVGLQALVTGLEKAKERLTKRLLETEGVLIYQGGREDLEAGRVDVRVVVLLGYLAKRYDRLTVSSLFSGHRMFARPGVVSAHMYGHAVDVAAVAGTSIAGHQQPGGVTEDAVRSILLLPSELQPRQVISLLGLGGPSFPLRDHGDHIHIGY